MLQFVRTGYLERVVGCVAGVGGSVSSLSGSTEEGGVSETEDLTD